jgi:putative transposase
MRNYSAPDFESYIKLRKSSSCAHKLDFHLVFVTKYRKQVLKEEKLISFLKEEFINICVKHDYILLSLDIQIDHVHILIGLKPSHFIPEVIQDLKGRTSYLALGKFPYLKSQLGLTKLWAGGYFIESLGKANVAQIKAYLDRQDEHHKTIDKDIMENFDKDGEVLDSNH